MVVKSTNPKVPHFNAPIYLENKVRQRPLHPQTPSACPPNLQLAARLKHQTLTLVPDCHRQSRRSPRPHQPSLLHHQALRRHPSDLLQARRQVLHCRREAAPAGAFPAQAQAAPGSGRQQGQEARRRAWRCSWWTRGTPWWRRARWPRRFKRRFRRWCSRRCRRSTWSWRLLARWSWRCRSGQVNGDLREICGNLLILLLRGSVYLSRRQSWRRRLGAIGPFYCENTWPYQNGPAGTLRAINPFVYPWDSMAYVLLDATKCGGRGRGKRDCLHKKQTTQRIPAGLRSYMGLWAGNC